MIGVLFHGPEVFDSGWARIIIEVLERVDRVRCVLAGTMGRTAAIDSGLQGIESPGTQPSQILRELQGAVDSVVFANYAKSEHSGLLHGAMIVHKSEIKIPLLQIECSGRCYVEWKEGINPEVIEELNKLGLERKDRPRQESSIWEEDGRVFRRLTTASAGEFVLIDGIVIGRALGGEVVVECSGRQIVGTKNIDIKLHGIEKLHRLGGIDLSTAKLASTSSLRRTAHAPRVAATYGKGVAFVDHAGMHIYDLMAKREGIVTIGDDTTAIVGDILYRSQIPLIGITDGDKDSLLGDTRFAPGSTVFTVPEDDQMGLRILSEIFRNQPVIEDEFRTIKDRISALIGRELIHRQDY
ncbi:MAG: DUF2117 domain-containing protein [Acidobacteria bacterium]|nr:DUF2117 domain-containing protein [Acidobacteriota bacterium]